MPVRLDRRIAVVAAAMALAAPAAATAASMDTAVEAVRAHTDRADAALDRAVSLFERNADRRGAAKLARSRGQMGKATAKAARLAREADSPEERAAAARARALVAAQQDENVEQLVDALSEVEGRIENRVAQAARADTRGREKAIGIISVLLDGGASPEAATGLATALAALSTDRAAEVREEAKALTSSEVGPKAKRRVARAVETSVEGQSDAADRLAALIADENMPAESKDGLQKAYDAVTADHGSVADVLSRFSDRMPARIRDFVSQIVQQARENAQGMRENRPAPPAAGTTGAPEGTPSGKPDGTPGP